MAANSHAHGAQQIRNPGPFVAPGSLTGVFGFLTLIGIICFLVGLKVDSTRAWASFLQNHFYFMSLALGGLFFASIQWLTGAMWSAPLRRVAESFTGYLPVALLTFVILYFGIHDLYSWSHPDHVKGDLVLEGKSGYLSIGFFMIRNIVALGVFMLFGWKMIGNSLKQDTTRSFVQTAQNRSLTPVFLILLGIGFTMAAFDQLMSLDPHWFSTMFGVYMFAGLFYSTLAMICLVTLYLKNKGYLEGIVNENHLHDLGKFMFAFTVFWAYIGFSQFLLIWYANLPEETGYFLNRFHGGWAWVSIFLLVGKFLVPFALLLPRDAKRSGSMLAVVGIWQLLSQWVDVMWVVQPEFYKDGPVIGWMEIGVTLGFLGLFGLVVVRFLTKNNVVAIGDPRLPEAVFHHHQ